MKTLYVIEFRMRANGSRRTTKWRPAFGMFPVHRSYRAAVKDVDAKGMTDNCEYRIIPYVRGEL